MLDQLQSFMPLMRQANQQLEGQNIPPSMTIDAKLQELSDSSESDSEEEEHAGEKGMSEEMTPQVLSSCEEVEFVSMHPFRTS